MYTIRQASLRSGVSVPLIRAWERRYGVPQPGRSSGGYRLYDDEAIATLRAMRQLVDDGWQPSAAAAAIRDGTVPVADAAPHLPDADGTALAERFVDAAARYDGRGLESALDEMTGRGSFEVVVDTLLLPAAVALGQRWQLGQLDVAAEHAASAAIMRRLSAAFEAAGLASQAPPVIVGMPPGARHELGALAFATALRRRGVGVVYLGPDVPIGSWVHAVAAAGAAGAVIGAVREEDAAAAAQVLEAVHAAAPQVRLAVGGKEAGGVATNVPLIVLPASVVAAAETMERAVR
ncbi:MAG TPA: MerR family transcriptional regulator [Candidatus Limnocylindria bacterium]|jgi:DNA-binding transcriptional MerR regulator|nr:MerR family transcriptional regulator [Candidatus Limnocylindria bacterium]